MTVKISDMTEASSAEGSDLLEIVDISAGASGSKRMTFTNLLSSLILLLSNDDIPWAKVDKTSSSLADLANKAATNLTATQTNILLGRETAGAGAVEEIDVTSFGRSLINSADAAAARSTLGVDSEINGWTLQTAAFTHVLEYYDGSSFTAISDWAPSTAYTTGDMVAETSDKLFYHECVASFTSDVTEPTWNDIGSVTGDTGSADWFARGRHVLAIDTDLTDTIKEGMAIKYKYTGSSVYAYAKVVGINASRIALAGPYLNSTTTIDEVWLGNTEKIEQVEIYYKGECGNSALEYMSRIDGSYPHAEYRWLRSPAYLVQMGYVVAHRDTIPPDEDLNINITLGGTTASVGFPVFIEIGTLSSYQGVYPTETYKITDYGSVNELQYLIDYNEDILGIKNTSSDGITTSDLFVTLVFVLE